jgi:hypothetical protein
MKVFETPARGMPLRIEETRRRRSFRSKID